MAGNRFFSSVPLLPLCYLFFFFFNDTATTEIYTLSLHDALPISCGEHQRAVFRVGLRADAEAAADVAVVQADPVERRAGDDYQVRPHHRHALRRRVNVEASGRGVGRDHPGPWLDRGARDSRRLERQ